MSALIQVSDSNAIVYISSTSFFAQVITVRDIGGNRSSSNTITVSTVNGLTWPDGTVTRLIDTPYASITFTSDAIPLHAFPFTYGGDADAQGLTVKGNLSVKDSVHVFDSLYVSNTLSSIGYLDAQSIRIGSESILTRPLLVDSIQSLGQYYTSSVTILADSLSSNGYTFCNALASTVAGLGSTYISSASLWSTVDGLGTYYVSTPSLVSTVTGMSNTYTLRSNLPSTVDGLGKLYISTASLVSTSIPFYDGYIRGSNYTSTVAGLGKSTYISTSQLTSTINGLGTIGYISVSWLVSTTIGLGGASVDDSAPFYVSTVEGLGNYYISRAHLVSSVTGILASNVSIMQSTIDGLGTARYISVNQLTSTVIGLSNRSDRFSIVQSNNLTSTVQGLFSSNYTTSFVSTVQGLGQSYVSTLIPLTNVLSNQTPLVSTVVGLGSTYVSTASLVSTVQGLSNTYITSSNLVSTVTDILANSSNLVSTVNGLGSLPSNAYISSTQLFSTVSNVILSNEALFALINNLASEPYRYISTASMVSTVQGLPYIIGSNLVSTVERVTSINTSNIVSTVNGLGSLPGNAYISSTQLFSTVSNVILSNEALFAIINNLASEPYRYISTASMVSTVQRLSNTYITSCNLVSTIQKVSGTDSSNLVSTVRGLGSLPGDAYISSTQLVSTVSNVILLNAALFLPLINNLASDPYRYISTDSLVSTVQRLSNIYITSSNLVSTIQNLGGVSALTDSNLVSTVVNLGSLPGNPYVSSTQLFSTVSNVLASNSAVFLQGMNNLASLPYRYISTASLTSTDTGLRIVYINQLNLTSTLGLSNTFTSNLNVTISNLVNDPGIVTPTQLFSTVSNVLASNSAVFLQGRNSLASPPYRYISTESLTSTVAGLSNLPSVPRTSLPPITESLTSNLVSTTNGLGSLPGNAYISSTQLISTVSNVSASNDALFLQVINNLASEPYRYISTASIVSTVRDLGSIYISTATLDAKVSDFTASTKYTGEQLTSSIANLGTTNYVSVASLTSTMTGLGGFGIVSLETLVASNIAMSNTYVFSNTVPTTYTTITVAASNLVEAAITSTVAGLGSLATPTGYGYISTTTGYIGTPLYVGIPTYLSCLYAAENTVLRSNTLRFLTNLGTQPAVINSNLPITVDSNSRLYIYRSNATTLSCNVSIPFDGIQMTNVYCTCNVTSDSFYASNYYADGTLLVNSSDKRLKIDITPLSNALESISRMEGISYRMIAEPDTECLGFIAQDIEALYPELVFTNEETKSLKYDSIGVIVLEAIKELNIQCDELLSTITTLPLKKYV